MGGVTEYLRAGALCDAYHQPVSSHLFMEVSAHVLAAAPNALILEHMDWWGELFTERLPLEDGQVVLPERPGLGLELSSAALRRFRV
jgi:L-alanine-DL-glutamate epimerase-like enolase superfamily enzyme